MILIVLCACAAVWSAGAEVSPAAGGEARANILSQELDVSPGGGYKWQFQTDNGIAAGAQGELRTLDPETQALTVQGEASWKSPEGEEIQLTYVADENGYQPQGSHIPTPPPIPPAILRALEYIAAHSEKPQTEKNL